MEHKPTRLSCSRWVVSFVFAGIFFSKAGLGNASGASADWSVTSPQGKQISSTSLAGHVIIVNFWATWCIPCLLEIPTFHDLERKYEKNGLKVVGVTVDGSSAAMIKEFATKFNMNYAVAAGNAGVMNNFGVTDTVPMTFVIDAHGKIVRRHIGIVKKEDLENEIRPLLKL